MVHVVLEGIFYADHYGAVLAQLRADHRGPTHGYYLDVPFTETLARHATKPIADEVGEAELRDWYRALDLLPGGVETVIGAADDAVMYAGVAARYGLGGTLVDPRGVSRRAGDVVAALLDHITPALVDSGDLREVSALVHRLLRDGTPADRQRRAMATGGIGALVELLTGRKRDRARARTRSPV